MWEGVHTMTTSTPSDFFVCDDEAIELAWQRLFESIRAEMAEDSQPPPVSISTATHESPSSSAQRVPVIINHQGGSQSGGSGLVLTSLFNDVTTGAQPSATTSSRMGPVVIDKSSAPTLTTTARSPATTTVRATTMSQTTTPETATQVRQPLTPETATQVRQPLKEISDQQTGVSNDSNESDSPLWRCDRCLSDFKQRRYLQSHKRICKGVSRDRTCSKCGRRFERPGRARRHEKVCKVKRPLSCKFCGRYFTRRNYATKHELICRYRGDEQPPPSGPRENKPQQQQQQQQQGQQPQQREQQQQQEQQPPPTQQQREQQLEQPQFHTDQQPPQQQQEEQQPLRQRQPEQPQFHTDPEQAPKQLVELGNNFYEGLGDMIVRSWSAIRSYSRRGRVQSLYNIRLVESSTLADVRDMLMAVFHQQSTSFRVNASLGLVLRDRFTGELRYFHSSVNNGRIHEEPFEINSLDHYNRFVDSLEQRDIVEYARAQRPNSKFIVVDVTNLTIFVNHTPEHPIGGRGGDTELPDYLSKRRGLRTVDNKWNLCFFHCLTLHRNPDLRAARKPKTRRFARQYFFDWICTSRGTQRQEYSERNMQNWLQDFEGVWLHDMESLESLFQVGITIYRLIPFGTRYVAILERRGNPRYTTMRLDLYRGETTDHLSYIKDLQRYAQSFACRHCGQKWKQASSCHRHEANCNRGPRHLYAGGAYHEKLTLFEEMERYGVNVPSELRYYEFRAVYDFECYFESALGTGLTAVHVPLSFSINSNVPGHDQPQCHVTTGDTQKLIRQFMTVLNEISDAAYVITRAKYEPYFDQLQQLANVYNDTQPPKHRFYRRRCTKYDEFIDRLHEYCRELVVLGFNSARYDLNAIKAPLMTLLYKYGGEIKQKGFRFIPEELGPRGDDNDNNNGDDDGARYPMKYVVCANNALTCICTDKLRFLDITQYLSACTYSKYLEAYGVSENKGYFCYEFIDSLGKLDYPQLPAYEEFFSELKGCNLLDDGVSEEKGRKNHAMLKQLWASQGWTSLRQLLIWYNNLDVGPFIEAVAKQFEFYKSLGLDMFKQAQSLPGLALKYAMENSDHNIQMFGRTKGWVFRLMSENLTGGPSIIFHRYHERNATRIRNLRYGDEAKFVQTIVGYDSNALYLYCFGQPMPTGNLVVRAARIFDRTHEVRL